MPGNQIYMISHTFVPYWKLILFRIKVKLKKHFNENWANPTSCSLFMTSKCNFKCPGCRRSVVGIRQTKDMTLNTVKKLISIYPSINLFTIAGLGEPTL